MQMQEYLEKALKRPIGVSVYLDCIELSRAFENTYDFYIIKMDGLEWLVAEPLMRFSLSFMRKHQRLMKILSGMECALYLKNQSIYIRNKMVEEGIPFIIWDKMVFLPFLDILVYARADKTIMPVEKIAFLTQKLMLLALYEKWQDMSAQEIAEKLNVTTMAVRKCFDEIQYLKLPVIKDVGRARLLSINASPKELWNLLEPVFRNPVIKTFEFIEDISANIKSGSSAICHYFGLQDNVYPTYAVTKRDLQRFQIKTREQALDDDEIGCVVQELGYCINFNGTGFVDPLTVYLSMGNEQKQNSKVKACVDAILKECT
ncbi:MAG: helix-turn-helix domain-containing protein [Clostridium sp.]|nr:helix-turn-helix domain-containing protein [Clostridium sp.]